MRIFLRYLKPHWHAVAAALLLAATSQIFMMLDPLILRRLIDRYATQHARLNAQEFFTGTAVLLAAMAGVAFVSWLAKVVNLDVVARIAQRVSSRMYTDAIRHSLQLPYAVFEDQRTGETTSAPQKLRSDVDRFVVAAVNSLFMSLVGVLFVVAYAWALGWIFATAFLLVACVIGAASVILSRRLKPIEKSIVAQTNALAGATVETLRNVELVKSLGLEQQEIARLDYSADQILNLQLQKISHIRALTFTQGICENLSRAAIVALLLYFLFTQRITVGAFFSLFLYTYFIFTPMQELGPLFNLYRQTEASLDNFAVVMERPRETRPKHPVPIGQLHSLSFHDVSFQHPGATVPAVSGVTFEASRGETIAFVGPTGSGKTTLVKLIVGLYTPRSGTIEHNGIDSSRIDSDRLREHIGLVTQDTQLFSGSVRDNLLFVRPDATDAECLEALQQAAALPMLERVNGGLDTTIGEGGVKVSGGEKQRLAIARALLRRPDVVIFDEATSSLDSLTEEEVSQTIRRVTASRRAIAILIAHRLSTVIYADRIYILERGRIIDQGRHEDLLARQGLYASLWRQQTGASAASTETSAMPNLSVTRGTSAG